MIYVTGEFCFARSAWVGMRCSPAAILTSMRLLRDLEVGPPPQIFPKLPQKPASTTLSPSDITSIAGYCEPLRCT